MLYLSHRCGENDNLIKLAYSLHELVHAWPLDDIYIVVISLDLYRYREICLMKDLGQ
jgi:hypothetical protein